MTAEVFESVKNDLGDEFEIQNTLSIEVREHWAGDQETAVVQVDTNYKPTRQSEYPVNLSLVDALKAAAALVRSVMSGYHMSDDVDAVELLLASQDVDGDIHDLRTVLLREVRNIESEEA